MTKINYDKAYYEKEVRVQHPSFAYSDGSLKTIDLDVEVLDFGGNVDCKVGHFGHNFWFRTPKGIREEKYTSVKRLEAAVERVLKTNGFTILGWN